MNKQLFGVDSIFQIQHTFLLCKFALPAPKGALAEILKPLKKISKRQFFRSGLVGMGAMVAGLHALDGLANTMLSMETANNSPLGGLGKFSKESPYSVATPKGIKCQICPNNCILKEGLDSICRTHVVKDGKLYTIAYGNPCSVHNDPIEKKPLFHFRPDHNPSFLQSYNCRRQPPTDTLVWDLLHSTRQKYPPDYPIGRHSSPRRRHSETMKGHLHWGVPHGR